MYQTEGVTVDAYPGSLMPRIFYGLVTLQNIEK